MDIEAFYFIRDPEAEHAKQAGPPGRQLYKKTPRDGEALARSIHTRFHRRYPNTAVPLVRLELEHLDRPFTRVA